mmetsp:Transcript_18362/g.26740  ORF Transcript_18362/g.26740 Transcript_18362/m.26740 type:complete len:102 (+) Transcript_18362:717-1022(+)
MGIRRRRNKSREPDNRGRGLDVNDETEVETKSLTPFADKLAYIYKSYDGKKAKKPYPTRKISNMWMAIWPPSMERICDEISMDGWMGFSSSRVAKSFIHKY